jgi:hypothetical protein
MSGFPELFVIELAKVRNVSIETVIDGLPYIYSGFHSEQKIRTKT